MALMSSQRFNSFKPSSSQTPRCKYEVFLSFRGEDVRDNFLEYLYRALRQKGILTFKDDAKLEDGERIDNGLFKAIEESKFSIVVLSKNYADSSWCLRELVRILECKRDNGHAVYPIFYNVSPSDVHKQKGAFGEGFAKKTKKSFLYDCAGCLPIFLTHSFLSKFCLEIKEEEVKRWRDALEEVGNLKGWVYPNAEFETEASLIDDLVHTIFRKSFSTYRVPGEDLVGIEYSMEQVIELLNLGSDETQVVGLWGMGGIGKTTLARAVYGSISWQFEGCCFIDNVREVFDRSGVLALQDKLISDILGEEDFKARSIMSGTSIIRNNVSRKKVLIVLDDVSEQKQIENLIENFHWFGNGSRIIITTRDTQVLTVYKAHHIFNVQELNEDEAIQLFKSKAFTENGEIKEFQGLIREAVGYCKGVPLALKVLGSSLLDGTVPVWKCALKRFRESTHVEVQRVLEIGFDRLDSTEKEIFLDIVCFFSGQNKDIVITILDSCGFNPVIGIEVLVKKSLLSISEYNNLQMHHLVQKMGRSIVDKESIKEPGERSRLWRPDDIKHVFMENTGTNKVECISYNDPEKIQLRPDAFAKMKNLRYLAVCGTCWSIDLPNKLRFLGWNGYPLRSMPSTFQPENLVELNLKNSCIEQLWDRTMVLPKLSVLSLSDSTSLIDSPKFTSFPNLEYLHFKNCTALVNLHSSIGKLKKLQSLGLEVCSSLQTLPDRIESPCLGYLNFSGCVKLDNILESFRDLKRLRYLNLNRTGITELPHSIGNSPDLDFLSCSHCKKLKSIPSGIGQLKKLRTLALRGCSSLNEVPEEVGLIDSLECLDVGLSGVRQIPDSILQLRNLQYLYFRGFKGIPSSNSLSSVPESISSLCFSLKGIWLGDSDIESLPASIKDLSNLKVFALVRCNNVQELPELPPKIDIVTVKSCQSLKTICCLTVYRDATHLMFGDCPKLKGNKEMNLMLASNFLFNQIIKGGGKNGHTCRTYIGPGSEIPEWFSYKNVGNSITLHQPIQNVSTSNLLGFVFSAVVAGDHLRPCKIGPTIELNGKTFNFGFDHFTSVLEFEAVHILYYPIEFFTVDELIHMGGTDFQVCFVRGKDGDKRGFYTTDRPMESAPEVKQCGAHLIYKDQIVGL